MAALLDVILPVFLLIGAGYLAVWRGYFSDTGVDGLMKFTQHFAIPCLLFSAISTLDLSAEFNPSAVSGFFAGLLGARLIFRRPWEDSVAIGFSCLFANSVLLGLPITERAYGLDALAANFAIIAIHAPFAYGVGITVMEIVRARTSGASLASLPRKVTKAMFSNALIIGIGLGFAVNLTGAPLPGALTDAVDMMVRAALPAALFGLGGVLYRYRPEGDAGTIVMICAVSLILHPTITYTLGRAFDLDRDALRSAVVTAAMAPGINTYLFANMYGVARRVAASGVLIGTALSLITVWVWLAILP
jgi:malonate transporter